MKPKFIVEPTDISTKLNSIVQTRCEVAAVPIASVRWEKLSANGEVERTIDGDELKLNFTRSDASLYRCQASNPLGSIAKTIRISFYGLFPKLFSKVLTLLVNFLKKPPHCENLSDHFAAKFATFSCGDLLFTV